MIRSKAQLFRLLLAVIRTDDPSLNCRGICSAARSLLRDGHYMQEEYEFVINTLKKEYLLLDRKFTKSPAYRRYSATELYNYWWTVDVKGNKQRILFLKHIISKLDEKPKTSFTGSNLISAIRSFVNRLCTRS